MSKTQCAVMFDADPFVSDAKGCMLDVGHSGPHQFIEAKTHQTYAWKTDLSCDCEHCQTCDGDFCVEYWVVG